MESGEPNGDRTAKLPAEIRRRYSALRISKVNAELWLNRLDVFNRLGKLYGLLGLLYLGLMFTSVFSPKRNLKGVALFALGPSFFGFAMHTTGLGLRWYVSGRAPWSNGYESMIYIGWTTVLAGLIFSRKSLGALTATNVLAATIMMVAGLSWLDPEITPLVPVLSLPAYHSRITLKRGVMVSWCSGAIIGRQRAADGDYPEQALK